jgi:hypothetical protein
MTDLIQRHCYKGDFNKKVEATETKGMTVKYFQERFGQIKQGIFLIIGILKSCLLNLIRMRIRSHHLSLCYFSG